MQESKNARLEEIGARCAASISGTCLSLLQGFSHCGVSQCDYERAPRPRLLETLLSNLTNDARLNGTENVTDRERWLVEQLNDLHAATRERLAECDRLVERAEAAEAENLELRAQMRKLKRKRISRVSHIPDDSKPRTER